MEGIIGRGSHYKLSASIKSWAHLAKNANLDIIGHFGKSTKTPFFFKASYMNMEDSIEMTPKGLLIGHLYISEKSKNTSLGSKLKELCIGKVDRFCKIAKSQMWPKLQFFAKWAQLFMLELSL